MIHTDQQVRDFVTTYVKQTYDVEHFKIVSCISTPEPESGNYPPEWEVGIQWTHDQGVNEDFTLSVQEPPTDGKPWLTVTTVDGTEPAYHPQNIKAMEEDQSDLARINREWQAYRNEGLGSGG